MNNLGYRGQTCKILEESKLLAICNSHVFNGAKDCSGISHRSSPYNPNCMMLQAKSKVQIINVNIVKLHPKGPKMEENGYISMT
ncbi:hypothetical protein SLEP1_g37800 [Rubroshorea leprosula]|uniref:Uncharacterized protein n=1 Tax=Rubroshorea leprosula TaxID=152421 RepID=A0AAV5KVW2_9ROSI|nr:hypothetical protein SLEP1_g37800 [Rubroshorea leprosula]